MSDSIQPRSMVCPVSIDDQQCVTLAHGEGARATRELIRQHVLSRFDHPSLSSLGDAAVLSVSGGRVAMTTDSFVVSPLFFPGGDIGKLAVYGTVNDLAVSGAVPKWLSLSLIVEEGLPLTILDQILDSIAAAAARCDVSVVTGDTKVVPRGAADGIFINTTGIGEFEINPPAGPASIRCGDALIVSGPIGSHGLSVLAAREELFLEPPLQSDSAPLHGAVAELLSAASDSVRAVRDATRGGLSAVLHEWSAECGLTMALRESQIPISQEVRGACELLGIDPLYSANEGTMVVAVDSLAVEECLAALRSVPETCEAACIGVVVESGTAPVTIERLLGTRQPVDEPTGSQLPRIC